MRQPADDEEKKDQPAEGGIDPKPSEKEEIILDDRQKDQDREKEAA
jgi:hypothetical protein